MKKNIIRTGLIIVTTVGITGISLFVDRTRSVADVTPTPPPTVLPTMLSGVSLVLMVQDGEIVFYNQPGGTSQSWRVERYTLVEARLVGEINLGGTEWFLLEGSEMPNGGGWVQSDEMTVQTGPTVTFNTFVFSAGSLSGPVGPSGSSLPLPFDALWLKWNYTGLQEGDVVQRVLSVNGEQYSAPPETWTGPPAGAYLANLTADHQPPVRPGLWTVYFIVNGDRVDEATVQIRAQ